MAHSKHDSDEDSSSSSSTDQQILEKEKQQQEEEETSDEAGEEEEEEEETSDEVGEEEEQEQEEETSDEVGEEEEQEQEEETSDEVGKEENEPEANISVPESSSKRPFQADSNSTSQSKRLKIEVSSVAEEETIQKSGKETKKQVFQRVFSEDDEVKLLNSMIEYSAKLDDPAATDLYDFILKSTNLGVTRTQLKDKIKRLKTKFKNTVRANRTVSDPFGIFDRCKILWGPEVDNEEATETRAERGFTVEKSGGTLFDKCDGASRSGTEEIVIQQGMRMVKGETKRSFEKKWRIVERLEMKAFLLRKQVVVELAEFMMKQRKNSQQN